MSIREFLPELKQYSDQDLLVYATYNFENYYLREVTSNSYWNIEACFDVFKDNKSFTVIFNKDVISPHRSYNHLEMQEIIDRLEEEYKLIKEII